MYYPQIWNNRRIWHVYDWRTQGVSHVKKFKYGGEKNNIQKWHGFKKIARPLQNGKKSLRKQHKLPGIAQVHITVYLGI